MANPAPEPRWLIADDRSGDGITTYRLQSWTDFTPFLEREIFSRDLQHRYVWRGQRSADWSLSTSLDRLFERLDPPNPEEAATGHLDTFRYAIRGRRGANPAKLCDDDLWAIGQHYGLATPLLDWTRSPYAAAYFAFEATGSDDLSHRAIVALDRTAVERQNALLESNQAKLQFIDPLIDENPRLVSQGGLFTKAPIGTPVERWVQQMFEAVNEPPVIIRLELPNTERGDCLRALSYMNLSHASLFPDIVGASIAANIALELGL